jgi:hypothetical protein
MRRRTCLTRRVATETIAHLALHREITGSSACLRDLADAVTESPGGDRRVLLLARLATVAGDLAVRDLAEGWDDHLAGLARRVAGLTKEMVETAWVLYEDGDLYPSEILDAAELSAR